MVENMQLRAFKLKIHSLTTRNFTYSEIVKYQQFCAVTITYSDKHLYKHLGEVQHLLADASVLRNIYTWQNCKGHKRDDTYSCLLTPLFNNETLSFNFSPLLLLLNKYYRIKLANL